MTDSDLESLCDRGQRELMEMEYLRAEATLAGAERLALSGGDFDALARLMLPLQEARRQRRQRCGEGIVRWDILARGPDDRLDAAALAAEYPQGQLLVAGWGTVAPAAELRAIQAARGLYAETFLAAAYPADRATAIVIVPSATTTLPAVRPRGFAELVADAPPRSVVLSASDLPPGPQRATPQTYARTMQMWERLHAPFLAAADAEMDARARIDLCRDAIDVDYACELAHQKLAAAARRLIRP